jgi:UDP-N-acetyl-D-glucosamine dehydrogenase
MALSNTVIWDKIETREAIVAIIGLGYVGLPLALVFAEAGYQVIGVDVDGNKVDAINRGESYIEDIPSEKLALFTGHHAGRGNGGQAETKRSARRGTFHATTDFSALNRCDAVCICVPTPLRKTGDPDISYIIGATDEIVRYLHKDMLIVLESTTYPGTTTEIILPRLLNGGGS